jgi:N-acetylglucosamine-6-phosphate deacetylase
MVEQVPRFIDLQVNGHGGIDLLSAASVDDIRTVNRSLFKNGVCAYLPTLITSDFKQLERAATLINQVKSSPEVGEARILGIHLEGPFISQVKCGVHPKQYISLPSISAMKEYLKVGEVKVVTLAPELPGALEVIRFLVDQGVVVSLGHSNATPQEAHAGFDAGAKTVTHLFNAMTKIPGLADVALEREDVVVQIIVDDIHVTRENVKSALTRCLNRFIMTNDPVAPAGVGEGRFAFGGMEIEIANGKALRLDGTLAGGIGTLQKSLDILADLKIEAAIAIASVTSRPLALINARSD